MINVDKLDVKLLNELKWNARQPCSELANKLEASESDVATRIKHLEAEGVIQYYDLNLFPNRIFCGHWLWIEAAITLESGSRVLKERIITALKTELKYCDTFDINTTIPSCSFADLTVTFYVNGRKEYEDEVNKIKNISGVVYVEPFIHEEWKKADIVSLSPKDWKIIRSLKNGVKKELTTISKETGIDLKTIKKRLNYILKDPTTRVMFAVTAIDWEQISNYAHIHFLLELSDDMTQNRLSEKLRGTGVHILPHGGQFKGFSVVSADVWSIRDLKEKLSKIESIHGVSIKAIALQDKFLPEQPWQESLIRS